MKKKKRKKLKIKAAPSKKFYRINSKLISSKHYWAAVRDIWEQFGYYLPDGQKHIEQSLEKRKWLSVALAYELAGYTHRDAFEALKGAERNIILSRLQPALGTDPVLVTRLIQFNKKIGGAARLFEHPYLEQFYKVTKIPKFKSVKTLNKFLTNWKRILKLPVRTHDDFSLKELEYRERAKRKLERKGYKGKR